MNKFQIFYSSRVNVPWGFRFDQTNGMELIRKAESALTMEDSLFIGGCEAFIKDHIFIRCKDSICYLSIDGSIDIAVLLYAEKMHPGTQDLTLTEVFSSVCAYILITVREYIIEWLNDPLRDHYELVEGWNDFDIDFLFD